MAIFIRLVQLRRRENQMWQIKICHIPMKLTIFVNFRKYIIAKDTKVPNTFELIRPGSLW